MTVWSTRARGAGRAAAGRSWAAHVLVGLALAACGGSDGGGAVDVVEADADAVEPAPDLVIVFEVTEDVAEVDVAPAPGELGWACDENVDCNSGFCVQTADGRRCTKTCIETCPDGWECRQSPGQDAVYICLPRYTLFCDPCREASDCNGPGQSGNLCIPRGDEGSFCGASCGEDGACPDGARCEEVLVPGAGSVAQCVPADGQCACSPYASQRQAATDCAISSEDGSCEGTRMCMQFGLSSCDAATPYPESCNGADDNCNDQVDEFPPDYACDIVNEFGTCKGRGTCVGGVETCVGESAKPELCNGLDDDCDGETDEGLCDDRNPCTRDFCNSEAACQNVVDDTLTCDDGNVCTQRDLCRSGQCQGFNPLACGDGNPCFEWVCDPAAGCLSSYANAAACEDGNPCTVNDSCRQGVCVAGGPNPCDDGNPCTLDSCAPGGGCTHRNADNGTACGGASSDGCTTGTCSNGRCLGTPIREGLPCTYGSAVPACKEAKCQAGACALRNLAAGTVCGNTEVCPPCVDAIGSAVGCCFGLLEETVNLRCSSTGTCTVQDPSRAVCGTANCGGSCAGTCVPACGIGICLQ
jgi:hypothetical protein